MSEALEEKKIQMVPRGNADFEEQFDEMATNFKINGALSPPAQALAGFMEKKKDAIIAKARELYPELEHPEQLTKEKTFDMTMQIGEHVKKLLQGVGGSEADINKMNSLLGQFTNMMHGTGK